MLRQEMESYPIIIEACLHNNDDSKQNEDTGWWMLLVNKIPAVANSGHGLRNGTNLGHFCQA